MKKRHLITGMILALTLSTSAFAAETVGINVPSRTAQEIQQRYIDLGLNKTVYPTYVVEPDFENRTTSGKLTDETLQNALDTLNFARYLVGLDDVKLSRGYTQKTQDGSFLMSLNGDMDHTPKRPDGISQTMFDDGYQGTYKGNIACGASTLSDFVIHGWLGDTGSKQNLTTVGHRRWCLNRQMAYTGFGFASQGYSYSAMYARSTGNKEADQYGLCWPAQIMPVEYFERGYGDDYAWSFSPGKSFYGEVTVTLTRENDGKTWSMYSGDGYQEYGSYALCNGEAYSKMGAIIFRPDDVYYQAGDKFHVNIIDAYDGVVADYTVEFINFDLSLTPKPIEKTLVKPELEPKPEPKPEPEVTPKPEPEIDYGTVNNTTSLASPWFQKDLYDALQADYPADTYCETYGQNITRGEFVHLISGYYKTFHGRYPKYGKNLSEYYKYVVFDDMGNVDESRTPNLSYEVRCMVGMEVIKGTSDTTFSPNGFLTREELATIILRQGQVFYSPKIEGDVSTYADGASISPWALDGMRYVTELEVLKGDDNGMLNPKGLVTIEQAQAILSRYFYGTL